MHFGAAAQPVVEVSALENRGQATKFHRHHCLVLRELPVWNFEACPRFSDLATFATG
jgi:hypothetical protein